MKKSLIVTAVIIAAALVSCTKTPAAKPVTLPAPDGLKVTSLSENELTFSWNSVNEAKCYSYSFNGEEEVFTNGLSASFGDLEPSEEYTFRIRSVSGDASKWSDSDWAEIKASTAERQPDPFTIQVLQTTFYSITVKIIPADGSMTYFCNVMSEKEMEKFAGDDEVIANDIRALSEMAEENGMTFGAFCNAMGLLNKGENEFTTSSGLEADTQYIEYVFGLSPEGQATSQLVKMPARTEKEPQVTPSDMTFKFEISDLTDISAKMTVTPSSDSEWYYAMFVSEDNYISYGGDRIIEMCLEDINEHITSSDFLQVMEKLCLKGKNTVSYGEFSPNTSYVGFAFGVGQQGLEAAASTRLSASEPFMTKGSGQQDGEIRIEVISWGIDNAEIKFIPSSEAIPYRCDLVPMETFAGLEDNDIISKDMEQLMNDYGDYYVMMLQYADFTLRRVMPLEPDTEYLAFAYGLSDTEFAATTGLCSKVLRTPAQ